MWANMLLLTETSERVSSFITLFRPAHTLSAAQHWRSGTFYNQEVLSLYLLVPLSSFRTERGPFSAPCPGPTVLHLVWVQLQSAESCCCTECWRFNIECVTLLQIQHFTSSSPQKQPAEREEDLTKSFWDVSNPSEQPAARVEGWFS